MTRRQRGIEFVLTGSAQGLLVAQSLVQMKLLTNYLDVSEYGVWTLIISFAGLVMMLPFSAFDQALGRLDFQHLRRPTFVGSAFVVYSTLLAVWSIALVLLGLAFGMYPIPPELLWPFLAFVASETIKSSAMVLANARRKRATIVGWRLFELAFRTVILLAPYWLQAPLSLADILTWYAVGNAIVLFSAGMLVPMSLKHSEARFTYRVLREISAFSWPLLTWAIFGWLQAMINRWYLAILMDPTSVAKYSVIISLSYFVPNFAYTVFATFVQPIVYGATSIDPRRVHWMLMAMLAAPLALYLFPVGFFAPELVSLVSSEQYVDMAPWLVPLSITSIVQVVAMISTIGIYREKMTHLLLVPGIVPGAVAAAFGYPVIAAFGLTGAILAYAGTQLLYAALALPITMRFARRVGDASK